MALTQITYTNKETLNEQPSVADKNKVKADDMNEIKSVVNTNASNVGDLTNLKTTNKNSIVESINELKENEEYLTTQEIDTGKTLGGKKIYRSYIDFAHSSTGTYTYNHNLNIDTVVNIMAFCTVSNQTISSNGYRQMPMVNTSNGYMFGIDTIKPNTITTNAVGWQNNHAYIWLEYTKTTD